jgi:hypothetical protein
MPKQNVALFIESVSRQASLNRELSASAPTLAAWTQVADKAGYQFDDTELHAVLEKLLDRKVPAETVIPEFLSSQSELDTAQLDQVVGGAGPGAGLVPLSPSTLQRVAGLSGLPQGAGAWGLHIKGPFNPGQQQGG